QFGSGLPPQSGRSAKRVRVETESIAIAARASATETEVHLQDILWHTRLDPHRAANAAPVATDLHDFVIVQAMFSGSGCAHHYAVVPHQLGDGPGKLLEPCV